MSSESELGLSGLGSRPWGHYLNLWNNLSCILGVTWNLSGSQNLYCGGDCSKLWSKGHCCLSVTQEPAGGHRWRKQLSWRRKLFVFVCLCGSAAFDWFQNSPGTRVLSNIFLQSHFFFISSLCIYEVMLHLPQYVRLSIDFVRNRAPRLKFALRSIWRSHNARGSMLTPMFVC